MKYTEHEKADAKQGTINVLNDFMEWLDHKGVVLCRDVEQHGLEALYSTKDLPLLFLGISPGALKAEQKRMVSDIKAL